MRGAVTPKFSLGKIVVSMDGSENSKRAARVAAELAAACA
jgi:nucleotide-binding universal stress UspA family protein